MLWTQVPQGKGQADGLVMVEDFGDGDNEWWEAQNFGWMCQGIWHLTSGHPLVQP